MKTCYVIDDESHAIQELKDHIENTPGASLLGYSGNPVEALHYFRENGVYADVTFVDIDMPKMSGIELSALLKGMTRVVLTTAFPDFGPQAFDLEVSDYLLKPVSYVRFLQCMERIEKSDEKRKDLPPGSGRDYFFVQSEVKGRFIKVYHKDVLFVEGQKNYVGIVTDKKTLLTYLTMSEMEKELPSTPFLRIHRSFIINMEMLSHVEGNELFLFGRKEGIPIGVSYRDSFFRLLNDQSIKTKRQTGGHFH